MKFAVHPHITTFRWFTHLHNRVQSLHNLRRPCYCGSDYPYPEASAYHPITYYAQSDPNSSYHSYNSRGMDPKQYNRKRQRRQAAAVVVESLWNNNAMGRKSTAQPRPQLHVPPRGIGPIAEPNENDVLCGRGGRINSHAGNIKFRDVINARKKEYLAPTTKKLEKAHIAAAIVNDIRGMDPPGRFLKEERDTGMWYDIGDAKAIKKTGQALREDAPDIRSELDSGDEETEKKPGAKEEKNTDKPKPAPKPKPPTAPKSNDSSTMIGHGPQHVPGSWQQGNGCASVVAQPDYQAQMAMPPPFSYQANPYIQQRHQQQQQPPQQQQQPVMQQQQGFEGRTIPIQSPVPNSVYSLPNQLVPGAASVGRRAPHASRHAMDALSQNQGHHGEHGRAELPLDNVAFGRQFYPPADTVLSSGNTVSTISGISDPISSTIGESAVTSEFGRGSAMSGFSGVSGLSGFDSAFSPRNSMRSSNRDPNIRMSGFGGPGMPRPSRAQFFEAMKAGNRFGDLTMSARSLGSMNRSLSVDDMSTVPDESWKPINEDEEMQQQAQPPEASVVSGEMVSERYFTTSGRAPNRDSSAMSVTSMSATSSARWPAGLKDTPMGDDGRSVLSEMSSELHALDLAHPST